MPGDGPFGYKRVRIEKNTVFRSHWYQFLYQFTKFTSIVNIFRNIEILQETSLHRSPISIDDTQQIDDTLEPQYVENNIQHLEISPNIPETIASGDET